MNHKDICKIINDDALSMFIKMFLQVNGKRLLGLNHKEVVGILKELPQHVRLVCARRKQESMEQNDQNNDYEDAQLNSGVNEITPISDRLVKAKSEMALASPDNVAMGDALNKNKSRSLEPLTNLAMWSSQPVIIELVKGDKGLGFSILDYQVMPLMIKLISI